MKKEKRASESREEVFRISQEDVEMRSTPKTATEFAQQTFEKPERTKRKGSILPAALTAVALIVALAAVLIAANWGKASYTAGDLFYSGLLPVCIDGQYGFMNKKGEMQIEPQFISAYGFDKSGLALVQVGGRYGFVNKNGKYIVNPQYMLALPFGEGELAAACRDGKWGYVSKNGTETVDFSYECANGFEKQGLAAVRRDGKWGYIDQTGAAVIDMKYDGAWDFDGEIAKVRVNDLYGFIDRAGNYVVPPELEQAGLVSGDSLIVFKKDGLWG